ncbi:peptidylprolyl isomerase [bacterium]|nr:peptidylprolyl isomerase [candidate division CSSED10-310 bacterium]
MLAVMRKKVKVLSKIALWPVIIAFIGTIFLVWGHGRTGPVGYSSVMRIDGHEIGDAEYQQTYNELSQYYRMLYGERFNEMMTTAQLREKTIERLINNYFKSEEARELGITVSPDRVKQEIMEIQAFRNEQNQFDPQRYQWFLQNRGYTPATFEATYARDLLIGKIDQFIISSAKVTEREIREEFSRRNDTASLSYILVEAKQFEEQVEPSEETLREYFEAHREDFREPAKIKVAYILLENKDFEAEAEVAPQEIEDYYNARLDEEFTEQESVKASHILIKVEEDAAEELQSSARKKIDEIAAKIAAGEDFAELAKQYSEDVGSGQRGGDLSFFTRGRMVKPFEDKAFAMAIGEVSEPVRSQFGWHIIKVTDKKAASVKQLDEARSTIELKLKKEKAKELAVQRADQLYEKFFQVREFSRITEGTTFNVQETDYFEPERPPRELGFSQELKDFIVIAADEVISPVLTTNMGALLVSYIGRQETYIPEFEDVHERVGTAVVQQESIKLAQDRATKIFDRIGSPENFNTVAEEEGLIVEESGDLRRSSKYVRKLGMSEELVNKVFRQPGVGLMAPVEVSKGYVLGRIDQRGEFDVQKFAEQRQTIASELKKQKGLEMIENWLQKKKDSAEIELSERYRDLEFVVSGGKAG